MEDYLEAVELLNGCELDLLELNISCPNVKAGGMNFGGEDRAGPPGGPGNPEGM
ncbi:MAG: hypothetical protein ACLR0U_04535 [Enterocloster clostridioformis]